MSEPSRVEISNWWPIFLVVLLFFGLRHVMRIADALETMAAHCQAGKATP